MCRDWSRPIHTDSRDTFPMMNFGSFTNPAKLVMIFDMLAGRLEIFPMLVLFLPDTWRRF